MSYNAVLVELLEHIAHTDKHVLIGWHKVQQWPDGLLKRLVATGVLVKASQAESIQCAECPNACFMDVLIYTSPESQAARAFVVCDDIDMQEEMGRINISLDSLRQWKTSAKHLAKVVAGLLDLDIRPEKIKSQDNIRLGMLSSKKGNRWVSLNIQPLTLEINQRTALLDELLFFDGESLVIDRVRINEMLVSAPLRQGKEYTPSTSKREAGKLKTEAKHQDWRDEYSRMKRQQPDMSDRAISKKIAAMNIARGAEASTIYRKMK